MAGLIGIGLTGILSQQAALNTTGNNITNANTPGYSRQEVLFETQEGQRTGAGTIGSGVNVADIRRLANEYLVQQVREDSTLYGEQEALNSELTRLDNLLGGESTGLSNALNNFFASLQNAAEDPTSLPQRQLVLSEAQQVVNRFQALNQEFIQQRESIKTQMQQGVKDANTLLKSIAELNLAISESPGIAQGQMPNELLDKRDEKLRQLSELISIKVSPADGSQVNVSLSNGLSLVVGSNASTLGTRENAEDPTRLEFTLSNGGRLLNIDEQITGGKLGGLLRFDTEGLKPAFDELGRIAIALSDTMNHQHEIGMDLEGELGGLFFTDINSLEAQRSRVVPNGNNAPSTNGQLAVEITDSSALPAGRWTLQFSGDGRSYELIDQGTGRTVNQGRLPDPPQSEISMPGFNIRVEGGTFNAGDKYLIQPSRNAAESIGLVVNREEDLAFASPVRATTGDDNIGTGKIDQGTMLNVRNPFTNSLLPAFQSTGQLANGPITVTFDDPGTGLVFTVTDGGGNPIGPANRPYTPGVANELFSDNPADGAEYQGFQFKITGQPADGDTFEINYNSNGVSDNRNAELLAALGTANTLNGGSQNFSEGYAGLVEDIGVKTRQSQLDVDAGKTLLEQSTNQRESVSGVNLDEEAGRLIQYQAAYNASAQVMSVAQDLFNTLLQSFR
ncbi:flagellar hook-associated protein 1 FlgK [Marinobacter sp. DSM 26671]|jgi:flagellar hook-associated protein 1 FlgK|uniref:Flagellar hook-associated protein 1 n=1 Tax=Marinobacter flavimaris TaxID=262076 RepID=A0A3D8H0Q5_9GAMM|nr:MULTISPECIES: flagellar hook-associated protein FlgK [Marinobacter]MCW8979710.1 flagellar hook-associated protein FlgK [Marinobacter sp.]HAU18591.1 flagellar hook-associated protein FlgK [Marinobacter adhaerens]PPI79713.1 flagellar hook-associated protein FlgK [Marinobacter flavimaris]RDU40021.1 flagellar hook-associated protein FlgK [Marinobacter flavimaris]SFE66853.1 flagellar hook-associated protein 1 FlgK [Marinobacter sp. DSM 26671]|tara:strand:- start:494 stop:2524 length:2031 start_codon:yes stop_codon:yes gene_type:complete